MPSGRIIIGKDSVETYLYPPGQYVKWNIDSSKAIAELTISPGNAFIEGTYYLSRPYGKSILMIKNGEIEQFVHFQKDTINYLNHIHAKKKYAWKE
jgi:hypothetical protein